jgi:hypothetical protein
MRNRKQRRLAAASAGNLQRTPNWGAGLPTGVDPLNFAAVKLQPFFNDVLLGNATGFFYFGFLGSKPNFWLVTNWHVLSGRNAEDPKSVLHKMGSVPNRLRLSLLLEFDQPEYTTNPNAQILFQEQFIELYDTAGQASWYQHVKRSAVDVAVLNASAFVGRFHLVGVNSAETASDMVIQIGSQIFILGYPLGFSHFMNTPIWKRGSIASEPHIETTESGGKVVIDATTRQGMSGAPVIMRETTHYITETGSINRGVNATRFVGVYASRPNVPIVADINDEDRRAEVGFFYKSGAVHEIITNGIRGPNFGELP